VQNLIGTIMARNGQPSDVALEQSGISDAGGSLRTGTPPQRATLDNQNRGDDPGLRQIREGALV
jgi:hypothetical protein